MLRERLHGTSVCWFPVCYIFLSSHRYGSLVYCTTCLPYLATDADVDADVMDVDDKAMEDDDDSDDDGGDADGTVLAWPSLQPYLQRSR